MLLSTYEHYLESLKPYANSSSTKFSAPQTMLTALSEIAAQKKTSRLDLLRFICAEYIHNNEKKRV